ncbi:MAG: hypothetical protein JMN25_08675 [gamma proteobacterium endosymbiont of Lamellibrachia anaximandri]|nr:hypothetical protein [gamma proteobacterium endosymbiont of Lamellibrachia anaximandri]
MQYTSTLEDWIYILRGGVDESYPPDQGKSPLYNEASNQQLWISYNYYHYNGTNQAGQYDNREHFYLTNVYVDENSGERVYPQSNMIDTRFDQWVNEKIVIDFSAKKMTYTLTDDDGSNPETLTLENIEFDRGETMLLRLNAWDWANGSEHIVDYLKISTSDSVAVNNVLDEKLPVSSPVLGLVSYGDQPHVPFGDVWVRIYPNHYQGSDQMGLNCKLVELPPYGTEAGFGREHCFVGNQDILNAFADPDERYHVSIYTDDNGDAQWNAGERVHCTPGESMRMSDLSYFNCEL